jgi:tetratricopeptide (TPR) repeat protein
LEVDILQRTIAIIPLFLFFIILLIGPNPFPASGSDYEFEEVNLFEGGYDPPEESNRVYETNFPKSSTRYIWCEVVLKNLLYSKRVHEHEIVCRFYDSDGNKLGDVAANVMIEPGWENVWVPQGLGWSEPGFWPGGTYEVQVIVDGKVEGGKEFAVFNDVPELEFEFLKFFESGEIIPEDAEFKYATRFPKSKTRYVNFLVGVKNLLWKTEDQRPLIFGRYFDSHDNLLAEVQASVNIPSSWENADIFNGWGWDEPGNWEEGTYRLEIVFGNKKISEETFTIYNDRNMEGSGKSQGEDSASLLIDIITEGVAYLEKGQYDRAVSQFSKAVKVDPGYVDAYYNRGLAYYSKGEYDRAISDYTRAIELFPQDFDAYFNRGLAHYGKGEYDRAISDYTQVIAINPADTQAYNNRGFLYYYKGEYDIAISDYTKAVDIDPGYTDAYYNRGLALYEKGDYDRASSDYSKVIELNPMDTDAYNNRGLIYYNRGQYDSALYDYSRIIEIDPGYIDAYFNRGLIYYNLKDYRKAAQDFKSVTELDPNDKEAADYLELSVGKNEIEKGTSRDKTIETDKPVPEMTGPKQKLSPESDKKEAERRVEIADVELYNIFPVLFKFYDENPVGRAVVKNSDSVTVTDVKLSFFVKRYMDLPKKIEAAKELRSGEEKTVDIYALFSDGVLEITEGTKVAGELILEYNYNGKVYERRRVETVRIYDRNATRWDDDRKAAAFVTAKDPVVLRFAKNSAGMISDRGSAAINKNLRTAIAFHSAMSLYEIGYVVDPLTPYKELSKNKAAVDFLQFPKQTLDYRAGDCDDLSILYSAMLESVGIETAFITIPGHIFVAFSVDMRPDEARMNFLRPDDLIFRDNKTWIPVEVTALNDGFLYAWQAGAKQWREAVARNNEGFYPVHDSWKMYEPVGLPGGTERIDFSARDELVSLYQKEVTKFIEREIYPKVIKLQTEIKNSDEDPDYINRLGVLYARYGLIERAEREFGKILDKDEGHIPALVNMGNVYFYEKDMDRALVYYEKAYENAPQNPTVMLGYARVNHELENYGIVRRVYDKLKKADPEMAMRFAYLELKGEEAKRAAGVAASTETLIWEED